MYIADILEIYTSNFNLGHDPDLESHSYLQPSMNKCRHNLKQYWVETKLHIFIDLDTSLNSYLSY